MALYSDNANRSARVNDLVNDISFIQSQMVQKNTDMNNNSQRTLGYLQSIANAAGYPDPESYNAAALAELTPTEKDKFETLRSWMASDSQIEKTASDALGGVGAVAAATKILTSDKLLCLYATIRRLLVIRNKAKVMSDEVDGAPPDEAPAENMPEDMTEDCLEASAEEKLAASSADAGVGTIQEGSEIASIVSGTASEASETVSTFVTVLRTGSEILGAAAIVATVGLLVYEGVEGAKQKTMLQKYTYQMAARRFAAQKMELQFEQATTYMQEAESLVSTNDTLQGLVTAGTITQDQMNQGMVNAINKFVPAYANSMCSITDDTVWAQVTLMDKNSNTWTNEDPTLAQIKQWMAEHPDGTDHSIGS